MKIGIIGAGNIGSALATHFRRLEHSVVIANSRGPETLSTVARDTGAVPVTVPEAARGVDLLVISIPLMNVPALPKDLLRDLPPGSPVVDTGNYYPLRDGRIDAIESGMTESEWTSSVLGRPVVKVFNNIMTASLAHGGLPRGSENRIALPVAGDEGKARQMVIALLDAMGFDGVDAGPLAESWRQQPGTPAYCTDLNREKLQDALRRADRAIAPLMRDAALQKLFSLPADTPPQELVRMAREQWTQLRTV
jgi:8-hydroxy-5-deazaflavin:NADPH oxidoreductase